MASIQKEFLIKASPNHVWSAIRDFGAVHQRLAREFVVDTRLEGSTRIVTFANGMIVRELLVDIDDDSRRLVYSVVPERLTHHNASMQVFAEGEEQARLIWIADLLPNDLAPAIASMMEEGTTAIKRTLEQGHLATP
jgi:carbon monoxide dehydrogenase subunit G